MRALSGIGAITLFAILAACHPSTDIDQGKANSGLSWVRIWQGDTLLIRESLFDSATGNGVVRAFGQDGHIIRELMYDSWNERFRREFFGNGSVASEHRETSNLTTVTAWRVSSPVSISSYDSLGYECGTWREWYENGQVRSEGSFLYPPAVVHCSDSPSTSTTQSGVSAFRIGPHNAKNGRWKYWDDEGHLVRLQIYNDGCLALDSIGSPPDSRERPAGALTSSQRAR